MCTHSVSHSLLGLLCLEHFTALPQYVVYFFFEVNVVCLYNNIYLHQVTYLFLKLDS